MIEFLWIWKKCAKKHMLFKLLRVCEDSVFIDIDIGQCSLCWCVWPHSKYSSQRQETSEDWHWLLPALSHSVPALIVSVSDSTPMDLQQSFTDCLMHTKLASSNLIGWIFWSKDKQVFFVSAWKQNHVYKIPGWHDWWFRMKLSLDWPVCQVLIS